MAYKNIVICSDGTGNSANKGRGTNVFKLYEAVDLNGHKLDPNDMEQVAFYDDGVGTESLKLLKILGGALGVGLSRNVRQLYTALCRCYNPGDRIYMFGFSRGAFTVRTLAGLIGDCGIIDRKHWDSDHVLSKLVRKAWRAHRRHYRAWLGRLLLFWIEDGNKVSKKFRDEFALTDETHRDGKAPIQFIGVWDTVDAVGLPFDHLTKFINTFIFRFSFPDTQLGEHVSKACHAISIDDERHTFHPVMWDEPPCGERIEQVWFSGVHSNVGGGYPKHGMSLVTLDWMMAKASQKGDDGKDGLRFIPELRRSYRKLQNINDKLYDSRAGLAVYYRYKPRDIKSICGKSGVTPRVHISTFDRIALGTEAYAPGYIPDNLQVVATPSNQTCQGEDAQGLIEFTEQIRKNLSQQKALKKAKKWVMSRQLAHYVLLIATVVAVWKVARFKPDEAELAEKSSQIPEAVEPAIGFLTGAGKVINEQIIPFILLNEKLAAVLLSVLILLWGLGALAKHITHRIYSKFWRGIYQPATNESLTSTPEENEQNTKKASS